MVTGDAVEHTDSAVSVNHGQAPHSDWLNASRVLPGPVEVMTGGGVAGTAAGRLGMGGLGG